MKKEEFVIGVLGGMGTYATINFFEQYADIFRGDKEWDRPRIIIDNRCTMPSRVRAYLYNEKKEELIEEMVDSIKNMIRAGGHDTRIVLDCNTSHLFLEDIYKCIPETKNMIVNLIDETVKYLKKNMVKKIYILGSEGTIESGIYTHALQNNGIECIIPETADYSKIRKCIEAVKQNKISDEIELAFRDLIEGHENVLLGCTELPILYNYFKMFDYSNGIYDPVKIVLNAIRKEYISYKE